VGVQISLAATAAFLLACLIAVTWIFRTGWKLKT
jgi:ABC-2 type transport system permease protein